MLPTTTIVVGDKELEVEIADTPDTRLKGLSGRDQLNPDKGMLFVWKDEDFRTVWAYDINFPLDVAFISRDGYIVDIVYNMKPKSTELYESQQPAQYALEVEAGWFQENDVVVSDSFAQE